MAPCFIRFSCRMKIERDTAFVQNFAITFILRGPCFPTMINDIVFFVQNHVDSYCKKFCNPNKYPELEAVNSSVCEQCFSWSNHYKNCKVVLAMFRSIKTFYLQGDVK